MNYSAKEFFYDNSFIDYKTSRAFRKPLDTMSQEELENVVNTLRQTLAVQIQNERPAVSVEWIRRNILNMAL